MDASLENFGIGDLTEKDRQEIKQFVNQEQAKAKFQDSELRPRACRPPPPPPPADASAPAPDVHSLTAMCWTKCIAANKIAGPAVDKAEGACLENCVNRYIDAQKSVIQQLEKAGGR